MEKKNVDRRHFERVRGLVGVDLNKDSDGVDTSAEGSLPDDNIGKQLHDGCSESWDGLFA